MGASAAPEPNGDSFITQNISVPSGTQTLTFYYWPSTTDSITYDWQEAQIRNTAGSTLASVMKVCSNAQAWQKVTFDMTPYAGTTVQLYFNVHGDGYGDLTYMYLDDVSVSAPPPNAVTNGGFETGTFSGWSTSGLQAPTVSSAQHHSGSYSAQLGNGQPFNGNSTIQQTVTVPSGSPTLTFWYQPHCPDSITYDQEQMQIRNTSGTVLATVLNVCSNSGAWTQVSYGMSSYAGQTVVLWFNDHDDGYATDPTYTYFDDISLQ
jgi:bacillopeptidase F (M6 metalloprotease family)